MLSNVRFFANYCQSKASFGGKTVVITGANSGIGKETARDLYGRGARVVLACRDTTKADEAVDEIKNSPRGRNSTATNRVENRLGQLVVCHLDLSSLESVRKCARHLLATESKIHILINNAGVFFHPLQITEDGFEMHFQVNHLAHFLLTLLLLPRMQQSTPGCKVINVSSTIHRIGDIYFDDLNLERSFSPGKAYCQSKLANVLFSCELDAQLRTAGIRDVNVYCLHPGVVKTDLGRHVSTTMFRGARTFMTLLFPFMKTAEQGAQTTVYCAVDEKAAEESGLYYEDCKVTRPSRKASDPDLAKRLWRRSCELLGFREDLPLEELLDAANTAA